MSAALKLYERLTEATDDKTRARLIADAFDELEARFTALSGLTTQGDVYESALRLRKEIAAMQVRLIQVIHRQTLVRVGAVGAILVLNRLLDAVIK